MSKVTDKKKVSQTRYIGHDGISVLKLIKELEEVVKTAPNAVVALEYDYGSMDLTVEWMRLETDDEVAWRLKQRKERLERILSEQEAQTESFEKELKELQDELC